MAEITGTAGKARIDNVSFGIKEWSIKYPPMPTEIDADGLPFSGRPLPYAEMATAISRANQVRMRPDLTPEQRQQMVTEVRRLWATVSPVTEPAIIDNVPEFNKPRRLISLQDE